jgi:hypothetical protein
MLSDDSSVDSFFNNPDFNFQDADEKSSEQPDEEKSNAIEIGLWTKRLCQGEKVAGMVKLIINKTLPKGKVLIRTRTKLVTRRLKDLPITNVQNFIDDYRRKQMKRNQPDM